MATQAASGVTAVAGTNIWPNPAPTITSTAARSTTATPTAAAAISCKASEYAYLEMTTIELTNVAAPSPDNLYGSAGAGITLPSHDSNNNPLTVWTFCKLTLDSATSPPASKFEVLATVMPYNVDSSGTTTGTAVSRTCGFLVQAKSTSTVATTTSE